MSEFDIMELLRAGMQAKQESFISNLPEADQAKRLEAFINRKVDFKVGERVVRNEDGENRYKFPKRNHVAIVASIFDKPLLDEHGNITHGEIAIVTPAGGSDSEVVCRTFAVDFRYYQRRPYAV